MTAVSRARCSHDLLVGVAEWSESVHVERQELKSVLKAPVQRTAYITAAAIVEVECQWYQRAGEAMSETRGHTVAHVQRDVLAARRPSWNQLFTQ